MKDVQNAVYSIVETRGKECYCILCHAIDVAIEHQPNMPRMQVICNEVRIRTGKRTNEAVSRALNRAAKDIRMAADANCALTGLRSRPRQRS